MRVRPTVLAALALVGPAACATTTPAFPPTTAPASTGDDGDDGYDGKRTEGDTTPATETDKAADEAAGDEHPPASWLAAVARYGSACPAPFFTLAHPESRTVAGQAFLLHGSRLQRVGPPAHGPLTFGVLGSIKDAAPETLANLRVAAREFQRAGAAFVVVNGDLVGETSDALGPVVDALGGTFPLPVLVHAGNSEWTSAFTDALDDAAARWPQIVNMNLIRDVDWGGIHVVSLPGYHDRTFLRQGACHYSADDVSATAEYARVLRDTGDIVILSAHGPPRGRGKHALDVIHDGVNVGDDQLGGLLRGGIAFGVFSHIIESGGRALDDVDADANVALPMRAPRTKLYVNVGAATSFGWSMLDGTTARGMAALVRVQRTGNSADAMVEFVRLR